MIYEAYKKENQEWDTFIERILGNNAQLISVSSFGENRRIYRYGGRIAKVRKVVNESLFRSQDLFGEYKTLSTLNGIKGICKNPEYYQECGWEVISYDYMPGTSLENVLNEKPGMGGISLLWKVLKLIIAVNRRGIVHGDTKPENIIVGEDGNAYLVDFDQAQSVSFPWSSVVDIFGINVGKHFSSFNFTRTLGRKNRLFYCLQINTILFMIVHRLSIKSLITQKPDLSKYFYTDNPDLKLLYRAWKIGRISPSNAPGQNIAYYSFGVGGCHFHGERSWIFRWHGISKKVNFKGKRVLELGCNLGLFSAFARCEGAQMCVGVDHDPTILEGARLVSNAFHVNNEFYLVDFDAEDRWEERFHEFDLVIALNVVNWLKNKDRFLAFLSRYNEVLYEGHEALNIEYGRLRRAGFNHIEIVMVSERNRAVLWASKDT
jgi:tRNA A-37 threonylcarbamoyl transferase component Bud32/SAM-dependent methyltransferase